MGTKDTRLQYYYSNQKQNGMILEIFRILSNENSDVLFDHIMFINYLYCFKSNQETNKVI